MGAASWFNSNMEYQKVLGWHLSRVIMADRDVLNLEELLKKRGMEVESMFRLSQIINAGLDRQLLAIVLELLEHGVHPESIADGEFHILFYTQYGPILLPCIYKP
jgi:hypothetical protein